MLFFAAPHANLAPITLGSQLVHPRNLLIATADSRGLDIAKLVGCRVLASYPEIGFSLVEAPVGRLVATRQALRHVLNADFDHAARPAYTPNDPYFPNMWHLPAIKADQAWDISLGTDGPVVAVIDTGVEVGHPDLAANIWINPNEIAGNGIDDDANGYVDDINGCDFVGNDGDPADENGHGTACAGIVAAVGDNGVGVIGIAPRARVMAIRAADSSGYFYNSATIPAYLYAANNGARIFSMSYYADSVVPAERAALDYAVGKGVLPIASAGNDRTVYPFYPAAYESTLSVAATNTSMLKASFSDFGSWVDVTAPGTSIQTTRRFSAYTTSFSGTSASAPVVAGLAALLLGADPSANANRLRFAIEDAATPVDQAPYGEYANYGFVDANGALARVTGAADALPPKPARVRYVTPIGVSPGGQTVVGRAYGRRLRTAVVQHGSVPAAVVGTGRDWVDFELPTGAGTLLLKSRGIVIGSFRAPVATGYVYPLIEAASPTGSVSGGFREALRADGETMVNTATTGDLVLQATFRGLPKSGPFTLVLQRRYVGGTGGQEYVYLYNWSGASYPYYQFDLLRSGTIPSVLKRITIAIPDIAPYVDDEGTAYLRIESESGSSQEIDMAYLAPVG